MLTQLQLGQDNMSDQNIHSCPVATQYKTDITTYIYYIHQWLHSLGHTETDKHTWLSSEPQA